jgi:RNA polymerase sigma factor (sigma-70 family)
MAKASPTLLRFVRGLTEAGELSDHDLVQRFADGRDDSAFTALVRRHGGMVLGVCRRVLGNEHDAEDVFQAAFLVLSRKAGSLRHKNAVGPWLFGVAHRLALRARQQGRNRQERESRVVERPTATALDKLTVREVQSVLDEELARLPERDRGPLVLCYLQGLTRDEAAQRLGCPLGTLKSRLARGRAILHRRLTRRGVAVNDVLATLLLPGACTSAMPVPLAARAVQAGIAFAGGSTVGGAVGLHAAALAKGFLQAAFLAQLKIGAACFLMTAAGVVLILSSSRDNHNDDNRVPTPFVPVQTKNRDELQQRAPAEPRQIRRRFLDLQPHANQQLKEDFAADEPGNNLAALPGGEQILAGVKFHIGEGLIQLKGKGSPHPAKVEGIKVGSMCSKLYFLHAAQWGAEKGEKNGAQIGSYTVIYEDKSQVSIPIVYGQDVRDWWYREALGPGRAEVAWEGTNEDAKKRNGATIRLYLTRWTNPEPTRKVVALDFASTNLGAAPFCVAITLEE